MHTQNIQYEIEIIGYTGSFKQQKLEQIYFENEIRRFSHIFDHRVLQPFNI